VKETPNSFVMKTKKKPKSGKFLKKFLKWCPTQKKKVKKKVLKKSFKYALKKLKCQKKNSNFISPFIMIINP